MLTFIGYFLIAFFAFVFLFVAVQTFSVEFPKWEWACHKMWWHVPPIKGDTESLCPRCKQKVEWNAHNSQWMTEKESAVYYANMSPDICDMAP